MSVRFKTLLALGLGVLGVMGRASAPLGAQRGGMFFGSMDDPAIKYSAAPLDNVVGVTTSKAAAARGDFLRAVLRSYVVRAPEPLPRLNQVMALRPAAPVRLQLTPRG